MSTQGAEIDVPSQLKSRVLPQLLYHKVQGGKKSPLRLLRTLALFAILPFLDRKEHKEPRSTRRKTRIIGAVISASEILGEMEFESERGREFLAILAIVIPKKYLIWGFKSRK